MSGRRASGARMVKPSAADGRWVMSSSLPPTFFTDQPVRLLILILPIKIDRQTYTHLHTCHCRRLEWDEHMIQ